MAVGESVGFDMTVVHDDRAHPDQNVVFYCAAMHKCVVPDRNVVANMELCFFIGAVQNRAILDIDFVAHPDAIDIAAHNRRKPN
jgi:hypothetical protein